MTQKSRTRIQQAFEATQKKREADVAEQESVRLARAEKTARLKALRLARDKAVGAAEAAKDGETETTPSPPMPKAHRHA